MCHMVMLPAETMLLILLELSILPREKLMLSQRLMLSMDMDTTTLDTATLVTATLDTATLGSQPTPDQLLLSPELPLHLFPDQLSLLSPELLHQLSPVSQLQLFLDLSFLATPALADLEVFGKRHSLRTVTKTSK